MSTVTMKDEAVQTNVANAEVNASGEQRETPKLTWKEKIGYGFGDFGNGFDRVKALGENYKEVQKQVNKNLSAGNYNWDKIRLY